VNASTWGLMLTGKLVDLADDTKREFGTAPSKRLVGRAGEPVIRLAVRQAMRIMGHQFVMGRTIDEALERAAARATTRPTAIPSTCSARRADDEGRRCATSRPTGRRSTPSASTGPFDDVFAAPSISVKLSALHPRYEHAKRARVLAELGAARAGTGATGQGATASA
jgi:RHH-type proline utilization regulon transcriptional repressor/proline dehydrogenase/delta 1-pyrroline-5-carboxylate dehydrogenase